VTDHNFTIQSYLRQCAWLSDRVVVPSARMGASTVRNRLRIHAGRGADTFSNRCQRSKPPCASIVLDQAVHRPRLPRFASITPEAWRRSHWTMVWVLPECSCRGDRATTNTIVQWPWGDTHAPITCALFADVTQSRSRGPALWKRDQTDPRGRRRMTGRTSPDVIGLDSPGEHCLGAAVVA
jgi:hypothetical protein